MITKTDIAVIAYEINKSLRTDGDIFSGLCAALLDRCSAGDFDSVDFLQGCLNGWKPAEPEIKVGSRVRCIHSRSSIDKHLVGLSGTVVRIDEHDSLLPYEVQFDAATGMDWMHPEEIMVI